MAALENDLLITLYDVARLIRRRADQLARLRGTTRAQWIVLARLMRHPGMTQSELASEVEVEPITVARLIDRMEARGLVERRRDPHDRRLRRLHLTDRAQPLLDDIDMMRSELNAAATDGLSAPTLACVTQALQQMKANLNAELLLSSEAV